MVSFCHEKQWNVSPRESEAGRWMLDAPWE